MSSKLFLKTMLCATMILGGASVALSHDFSHSESNVQPVTQKAYETPVQEAQTVQFDGIELQPHQIDAKITRSSVTELSQAYNVTFSSLITGHTFYGVGGDKNIYISITDPDYNGDENVKGKPTFDGQAYRIEEVRGSDRNLVIPEKLASGSRYFIEVKSIAPNLISNKDCALKIKSIVIPESIKSIDKDAFKLLSDEKLKHIVFNIVSEKNAAGITFDETVFPAGSEINWGYKPTSEELKIIKNAKVTVPSKSFPNGFDYILGYDKPDHKNLFLQIAYFVNNENKPRILDLPIDDKIKNYDAIGSINGKPSFDKTIDIPLAEDEVVDDNKIYFLGIYPMSNDNKPILTDKDGNSLKGYIKARIYTEKDYLKDFIDYKFDSITSYNGYTAINGKVDCRVTPENPGIYLNFKNSIYRNNRSELMNGELVFRTRFTSLNSATLIVHYENKDGKIDTVNVEVETRYPFYNLPKEKGSDFLFLLKNSDVASDFNAKSIRGMELKNFYITLDIFSIENQKPIVKSDFSTRFGIMEFVPHQTESFDVYNIDFALILTAVIYTVIFVAIAVGYFLFAKNKYKNDEFKRVKPKQFVKNATIAFAGLGIVIFTLMFIIFRFGALNNSTVVYNPTDPLVVGFAVASILVIGYYVKFFTTLAKANIEKRKTEKLKLNEDVTNDGTN